MHARKHVLSFVQDRKGEGYNSRRKAPSKEEERKKELITLYVIKLHFFSSSETQYTRLFL